MKIIYLLTKFFQMTGLHNYSFVINEAHRYVCNHNQRNKKQEKQTRRKM